MLEYTTGTRNPTSLFCGPTSTSHRTQTEANAPIFGRRLAVSISRRQGTARPFRFAPAKRVFSHSSKSDASTSVTMPPRSTTETEPRSSEITTASASDPSVMPTAARWRVP